MDTICESVPPCVYTIDDSLSGGIVVEQSPVGGGDIDDDGLLHLLNVPVDEPPLGVSDSDDEHASSVATTELDISDAEPGGGAGALGLVADEALACRRARGCDRDRG